MRITWQTHAVEDLASIYDYVSRDNPDAAQKLVAVIVRYTNDQLTTFSLSGRSGRVKGTRELAVSNSPYIVAYRIKGDAIDILAVHHTARRWPDRL